MNKEIYFKDFEGLAHHHDFITKELEHTIGKFEQFRPIDLRMTIDSLTNKKNSFNEHQFGCEVIAHHPSVKTTIVVHKFSKDFYTAVRLACKAVENILRKHSKGKPAARRRGYENVSHQLNSAQSPQESAF